MATPSNYSNPLLQTSTLSVFSERPSQENLWQVQKLTQPVNSQPSELHAVAVARRTNGLSSAEALGGGTVHQDVHPPQEGHRSRGKEDPLAASHSAKTGDEEGGGSGNKTSTPKKTRCWTGTSHTRPVPSQLLVILQDHNTLPKSLVKELRM